MSFVDDTTFYKTRDQILSEMIAALQAGIPDVYVGDDGVLYIIFSVEAGQIENTLLANQLLANDMWVQSAGLQALKMHGQMYGIYMSEGVRSTGAVVFTGVDGTYIPIGTQIAHDPGNGLEIVYFDTTSDGTIPDTGIPAAPVAAINVTAGNLNGTYEYVVTFVTAAGETEPGPVSNAVSPANQQVNLTIPVGNSGVTARRIYRDKNGTGTFRRVAEIAGNVTTAYTDNITDAVVAGNSQAPTADTAHSVTVDAQAESPGTEGNVAANGISVLSNAPGGLTLVTNPSAMVGGQNADEIEDFRQKILNRLRNAQTGSALDLKAWAEAVNGIESATVFQNNNLGVAANGHVTVRISATGGGLPTSEQITTVQQALDDQDIANITIHVAGFTAVVQDVTVDVSTSVDYTLADVTPSVQEAVSNYINQLEVGETFYLSGVIAAVKILPGVVDVVVTSPASNQTTSSDHKFVAGTVTVV